ncbi:Hypothetical predicted protein [Podarcis lilfordi]|uniref:Uncharacterized protein n=1 Tax=Podarcis lilfordi TaxID=74358 RepID=A0AA35KML0_9SAUR|nr:Hypothetical predicted protein [Podarcis lilfordi]
MRVRCLIPASALDSQRAARNRPEKRGGGGEKGARACASKLPPSVPYTRPCKRAARGWGAERGPDEAEEEPSSAQPSCQRRAPHPPAQA